MSRLAGLARTAAAMTIVALPLALAVPLAFAQDFPALTGRVVDQAGILPAADEAAISAMLAAHEEKTTNQVVVATISSLGGQAIEEYGVALGRAWGIGQAGKDNGAILIVAPNERDMRIEVGYGLEGELTDAISRLIIEGSIAPRFRAGDFPGGIRRGTEDILAVLEGDASAFAERTARRVSEEDTFGAAFKIVVFAIIMFAWLSVFGGRNRRRYGGGPIVFGAGGGGGRGSSSGGFSGGFSGGGGSFGGGGASGKW